MRSASAGADRAQIASIPREVLADGSLQFTGTRVTRHIARVSPGRLLVTHWGYDDGEHIGDTLAGWDAELARAGALEVFVNASQQTGLAAPTREAAAAWPRNGGWTYAPPTCCPAPG